MSKKHQPRRNRGVQIKKRPDATAVEEPVPVAGEEGVVPHGDIYLSVVRTFGFDPIREAEERRRL